VLALLGAFMIAGMIAYVFNTGRHAQLQQQTQHAADATAISGAGYVARSFNTVAMNNVEISRLIAVVQMLDAVPQSVAFTLLDVRATLERVEQQLRKGTGDALGDDTLEDIRDDLSEQERELVDMDTFFNKGSYDVREMTYYSSVFGRGELWKAMESLEIISIATMEQIGDLMQATGDEAGLRNMRGSGGETLAVVAPFVPQYIWERYTFDDFRMPVVEGHLPEWVDDRVTNRGPYDTIFGWRRGKYDGGYWVRTGDDSSPRKTTQSAGSSWSNTTSGGKRNGYWVKGKLIGYETRGTWWWLGRKIHDIISNQKILQESWFATRVTGIGGIKLNYLWPGSAEIPDFVDIEPEWVTDYEEAVNIISSGSPPVVFTQFIRMDYEQLYINNSPVSPEEMVDWQIMRKRGGWAAVPGAIRVRDYVWEDEKVDEWDVSYTLPNGATKTDVYAMHYRWLYVWAGINIGQQITIDNPNNFTDRTDLPAPIDFDHDQMFRPEDGAIGQPGSPFAFLGIAKQPNQGPLWGQLFDTSAYDGHVAIAQAGLFNNHSWDLWTQMWHAQLEPVQDYSEWLSLMRSEIGNLPANNDISTGELTQTLDYLESLQNLAPVMLTH